MAAMSDYLEPLILEHILDNVTFTSPTSTFCSLHTADPTDTDGNEHPSSGAYARVTITGGTQWTTTGTATRTSNTNAITFPTATANWTTVTHMGLHDAATVGNLLFHGVLDDPRTVLDTDTIEFAALSLGITLT